jgi:glyceraldehyde 3-phosphate dehydrogenase
MGVKVAINGFGRVGRCVLRAILKHHPDLEVVAINDITDVKTNAHLFKYDSNYGTWPGEVKVDGDYMIVDGKKIKVLSEKDPARLPWGDLGVHTVVESTGIFKDGLKAAIHIANGAKKVIVSAPTKNEDKSLCMGVNEKDYDPAKHHVVSNASCTTNCLAPVAKVLNDTFGIKQGLMTTIHAYTNDQRILDLPHKDLRRARAAALSIIPTTTGAAQAVSLVIPELQGKFAGFALRVPTPTVSLVDFVAVLDRETTKEEVNKTFRDASEGALKGILGYCEEELVSIDFKGTCNSATVDAAYTTVSGNLVKILAWYDNEWGYSCRLAELAHYMANKEHLVKA